MNFDIISLIVLILSVLGLTILVFKKAPILKGMPEPEHIFLKKEFKKKIKEKTKEVIKENSNFLEAMLHKLLSKIRILSLKTDNKMSAWIKRLRERSVERTKDFDNYWKEIKASVKKKKDDGK